MTQSLKQLQQQRQTSKSSLYLTDQTKDHSFYSRPKSFKTDHTTYVKNGLDKRLYKSPRLLRNRNRNNNLSKELSQIYQDSHSKRRNEMRRLASSIREGLYSRQIRRSLRRTLRRRKASAIAAARPAASRPRVHGFCNPITTPCSSLR